MVMGVAPFESPPSPLSDDISTLLYRYFGDKVTPWIKLPPSPAGNLSSQLERG